MVTFDDGYASTLRAKPILDALGYPGTVFPVLEAVESGERLCWPGIEEWSRSEHAEELVPLTWRDLESLVESSWEVGSHTVTHPCLPELSDEELASQLGKSRQRLATQLGGCTTIAYPYGYADRRVARAAQAAGYLAGCTLTRFHLVDEPFLRPRIGLFSGDRGLRLAAKLSRPAAAVRRSRVAARAVGGD